MLDPGDVGSEAGCFLIASAGHVVVVDDAHPVDLGTEMRRAPAEEHQAIGAARHRTHGHAAHLTRLGRHGREGRLTTEAGGLLGDDEIAREAAADIEVKRLRCRMAAGALHLVVEHRVDVEPEEIQILSGTVLGNRCRPAGLGCER